MPIPTPNSNTIAQLAAALSQPGSSVLLNDEQRGLLSAALTELATAQHTIAVQQILLRSFNQDAAAIEAKARAAIEAFSPGAGKGPAFDFSTAAAARRELISAIETEARLDAIIAAALNFAARVALPGG